MKPEELVPFHDYKMPKGAVWRFLKHDPERVDPRRWLFAGDTKKHWRAIEWVELLTAMPMPEPLPMPTGGIRESCDRCCTLHTSLVHFELHRQRVRLCLGCASAISEELEQFIRSFVPTERDIREVVKGGGQ